MEAILWCDASYQAIGACLQLNGDIVEDKAWEYSFENINVAELQAVLKGLELARKYSVQKVIVKTDSTTVCRWFEKGVKPGEARALLLAIIQMKSEIQFSIEWVKSLDNKADSRTNIRASFLGLMRR